MYINLSTDLPKKKLDDRKIINDCIGFIYFFFYGVINVRFFLFERINKEWLFFFICIPHDVRSTFLSLQNERIELTKLSLPRIDAAIRIQVLRWKAFCDSQNCI